MKSDTLSDCLREVAGQPARAGLTHAQHLAAVVWRRAEAGDMRAAAIILDRLEGRPGQHVEVDTAGQTCTSVVFENGLMSLSESAALMHTGEIPRPAAESGGKPE